ncbi:MAG TPA: HAMP domain-containing sensor histidine kinase, partial [Steroidobacteraceae bacterium]|nr:HAMP domain-containing sensor histidine kinase [Steroidobacteraceae bacterium]
PAWLVAEVSGQLVVRPMREQLFQVLAWTGLLVVALALGLGYWLARRTAKPLSRLATLVEGMSPEHMPTSFAQDFADDEVGVLARGLEGLIGRVRAFIAREQEFTRDASHELRTPLAVIRGATERLAAEPHLSNDGRRHLEHVRQSAAQLEQTVTTLLSLAREDAAGELMTAPVALLPVLERVIVEQSRLLEGKPVTVEVQVPPAMTFALPAPVLHILLSNLVGNAFAHAECGQVRIELAQGRLCIANRSSSLSADDLSDLYQPFRKREGSAGFGLGLSIVRRLCDRHAIDLRIDSTGDEIHASFAPLAGGDAPR